MPRSSMPFKDLVVNQTMSSALFLSFAFKYLEIMLFTMPKDTLHFEVISVCVGGAKSLTIEVWSASSIEPGLTAWICMLAWLAVYNVSKGLTFFGFSR